MITNTEYSGFLIGNKNLFLRDDYQIDFIKNNIIVIFQNPNILNFDLNEWLEMLIKIITSTVFSSIVGVLAFVFNDFSVNNVLLHLVIAIDRLKNTVKSKRPLLIFMSLTQRFRPLP